MAFVRGEADGVPLRPAGLGERRHQRLALGVEIAGEPAPAVVATETAPGLDERDPLPGMSAMQRQGDQPASQSAANHGDIEVTPIHCGFALGSNVH